MTYNAFLPARKKAYISLKPFVSANFEWYRGGPERYPGILLSRYFFFWLGHGFTIMIRISNI